MQKKSRSKVNVMRTDDNDSDSSGFSLSITHIISYSDMFEWIKDTSSAYHFYPKRELFTSFEELGDSLMSMGDDHIYWLVGKGIVRVKIFDGMVR